MGLLTDDRAARLRRRDRVAGQPACVLLGRRTGLGLRQADAAEAAGAGDDLVPERPEVVQQAQLDAGPGMAVEQIADRLRWSERLDRLDRDQGVRLGLADRVEPARRQAVRVQ